jgi:hypothetical protein
MDGWKKRFASSKTGKPPQINVSQWRREGFYITDRQPMLALGPTTYLNNFYGVL